MYSVSWNILNAYEYEQNADLINTNKFMTVFFHSIVSELTVARRCTVMQRLYQRNAVT